MITWDELEYLWRQGDLASVEAAFRSSVLGPYGVGVMRLWYHFERHMRRGDSFLVRERPEMWMQAIAVRWTAYFEFGEGGPYGEIMTCCYHDLSGEQKTSEHHVSVSPLGRYGTFAEAPLTPRGDKLLSIGEFVRQNGVENVHHLYLSKARRSELLEDCEHGRITQEPSRTAWVRAVLDVSEKRERERERERERKRRGGVD